MYVHVYDLLQTSAVIVHCLVIIALHHIISYAVSMTWSHLPKWTHNFTYVPAVKLMAHTCPLFLLIGCDLHMLVSCQSRYVVTANLQFLLTSHESFQLRGNWGWCFSTLFENNAIVVLDILMQFHEHIQVPSLVDKRQWDLLWNPSWYMCQKELSVLASRTGLHRWDEQVPQKSWHLPQPCCAETPTLQPDWVLPAAIYMSILRLWINYP